MILRPVLTLSSLLPILRLAFLLLALSGLTACETQQKPGVLLSGATMGTQWHAALVALPEGISQAQIADEIAQRLVLVNQQMSTWQTDSELSRFNQYSGTDWFTVSPALITVAEEAQKISELSQGVFDVTVGPLVNLWGFGPSKAGKQAVPSAEKVAETKQKVGYQQLKVRRDPPALRKTIPDLYVDLSAIAKGYGVDVIARYFDELGIKDYMIEIGGEIFARGLSPRGDGWRIAIEKPVSTKRDIQQGVHLSGAGLATSGDYRNFFTEGGQRYSHTVDVTTGYPVKYRLASVSVLADNTMLADGYATMLMAMGEVKGKAFAEQQGLAAYFIWRTDEGFASYATNNFQGILLDLSVD